MIVNLQNLCLTGAMFMIMRRKKIIWIAAMIIIAAIAIVLCVGFLGSHSDEFDGTLVKENIIMEA